MIIFSNTEVRYVQVYMQLHGVCSLTGMLHCSYGCACRAGADPGDPGLQLGWCTAVAFAI